MKVTLVDCIWNRVEPPPPGFYDEFESIVYDAFQSENAVDFCYLASPLRKHFEVTRTNMLASIMHEGRTVALIHN